MQYSTILYDAYRMALHTGNFLKANKRRWVLSKNCLRIAVGCLIKVLEIIFCDKLYQMSIFQRRP